MAIYTPAMLASMKHDVEETDIPLHAVAKKHGIGKRTLLRLSDREGWQKRSERLHDLPPAARLLSEATALLTERSERDDNRDDGITGPPTPNPSPPFACCHDAGCVNLPAMRMEGGEPSTSAIDRLERLVEKELDAEEAVRAQLGPLPRNPADAERTARTLSTLTQTLHALQRLRSGLGLQTDDDDDDIPRDIDEFRRDLARRIEAFVASRTPRGDAGGDPEPRAVDALR